MIQKYASALVLEAAVAPQGATMVKDAHRHDFVYAPRPGYLYVRSRAISSRCNDNYDEFPAEEIKRAYRTFVGKPVFVNHHNANHRRMRGVIVDAALHEDANPDGSPDTWVEVLMEVDAVRFPKLTEAILAEAIDRTSMGTDVAYSLCSFCGNKATTPLEYCQHIPKLKGKRIRRRTANGSQEDVLVREICYGLHFFENSLLVEEPADPTAFFLGVDASGLRAAAVKESVADPSGWSDASTAPIVKEVRKRSGWLLHDETRAVYEHAGHKGWVEQGRYGGEGFGAEIIWGNGGGREYLGKGSYASAKTAMDAIERRMHKYIPRASESGPSEELFYAGDDAPQRWQRRPLAARTASKVGFGETVAPAQVDTLRDELCPVCGEADSYDTERCLVCGFTKPPDQFMDPDLDAAKQNDLRQEQDDAVVDAGGQGNLECDNCGATFNDDSGDAPQGEIDAYVPEGTTDEDKDQQRAEFPEKDDEDERPDPEEKTPPDEDKIDPAEKKVDPNNAAKPDPDARTDPAKMQNTLPKPKRDGEEDADPENAAKPDPAPKQEDAVPETAPKAGDACPTCGQGTLQPKSVPTKSKPKPGEEDGTKDKDEEKPDDKDGKKPFPPKKKSALSQTAKGQSVEGVDVDMRPALAALAEQQKIINTQDKRIAALEEGFGFIADLAGVKDHPRVASLLKRADENNPAQPIPDPASEAPAATTDETLGELNEEDVTQVGATGTTDVSADATTSVEDTGVVLDEPLDLNEQDPTRPVAGTEGPRPVDEVRTETEVRAGTPADTSPAFPLQGPFTERKTVGSQGRTIASLRLARLRIQAGIEEGDDLSLGTEIDASQASDAEIQAEIDTLAKVVTASAKQQPQQRVARNLVPQRAAQADRTVPSMQTQASQHGSSEEFVAPMQVVASGPADEEFLFE